jgi:hypothetical protein
LIPRKYLITISTTHSGTYGPNETPIGDQRGVSIFICKNEKYKILIGISQTISQKTVLISQ